MALQQPNTIPAWELRPADVGRELPALPANWRWRADEAAHLLPEVPNAPLYLWNAEQIDGDGAVYYDGVDTIKGADVDVSSSIAFLDEVTRVRELVVVANREAISAIKDAWARHERAGA